MTKNEKLDKRIERECHWHKTFAWLPVMIVKDGTHYKAWLEYVGCKKEVYDEERDYRVYETCGNAIYCFIEDLLFKKLKDDEIIDKRRK